MRALAFLLAGFLLLAGCAEPDGAASPSPAPSAAPAPRVAGEVVVGLDAPWSMLPLAGERALVSLRDRAEVLLLSRAADGWSVRPAGSVPGVAPRGEGGLMGLALDPGGRWVYAMLTAAGDNRVVRMRWDGERLSAPEPVLTGIPKAEIHNGGRIAFAPDGTLFVATGDAGVPERAQDPDSLAGKILRINPDGSAPADNPRAGSPVYSIGHRNVQGLAFDGDGRLWASEFGAKDADEINLIVAGGNYGWPEVEGFGGGDRFQQPAVTFEPTSTASPSGIAVADGSLWVATLRGQTLYQVPLRDGTAGEPIAHLVGQHGRLRDVAVVTDGLWVLTNNTDGRGRPSAGDDRILHLLLP